MKLVDASWEIPFKERNVAEDSALIKQKETTSFANRPTDKTVPEENSTVRRHLKELIREEKAELQKYIDLV